jgi:tetratricopeptide (TPR) repeat protein
MSDKTIDHLLLQSMQLQHAGKLVEARSALRKILKQSPLHAEALYLTGMTYLRAQEHEKGAEYLRRVLSLLPDHAEAHYNLGVALGKLKCSEEALECHRKAVACKPDYWKARVRMGELLNLLQRHEEALAQCLQIVAIKPDCADAYFGMGVAYAALERPEEAIIAYRQAVRLDLRHADAYNNLGYSLAGLKRFDEAVLAFYSAIAARADFMDAHIGLARALVNLKRHDEAIAIYLKAYLIRPDAECAYELARLLQELKRFDEAADYYRHAVAAKSDYVKALDCLGNMLADLKRHEEAIATFKQILALDANDVPALVNLGNSMYESRVFEEAIDYFQRVFVLDPDNVAAHNGLGSVLVELNRVDEAIAHFHRALELDPNYDGAVYNLGVAMERQFRYDEAVEKYGQAVEMKPDFAEARWNRALVHLLHGRLGDGWPDYEYRRQLREAPAVQEIPYPRWDSTVKLAGKKLLIQAEQGFGDAIQAVRYIPLLEQRGVECWMQCLKPLTGIIRRSFPQVHIVEVGEVPPELDLYLPVMSLPGAMQTNAEADIPVEVPYLVPDAERAAYWKQQLPTGFRKRVGLVWRGNPKHGNDHNRSSRLHDYLPAITDNTDVLFVTLQKDMTAEEQALLQGLPNVQILDAELADFDDSAAVMCNLDCVITIDSAPAHLAGALGIPVWILLPFHSEWRWLRDRDDSPWYPTARLFRQTAFGDWQGVIKKVDTQLKQLGETSNA